MTRFGAGFLGHLSSRNGPERLLELARVCEAGGLDSFWVADQRWMRDVYVSLALVACSTERILLGTRLTDPYARHPALTAVAVATLDEVSRGRAVLGIGPGTSGFRQLGIVRRRPVTAVAEAVRLIRALWRGGPTELKGQVITFDAGALDFPARPDIPIVIVTRSPKLLELAGELADGAILASGVAPDGIRWALDRISAGEQRAGRPPGSTELLHMTYVSIDEDRARARRAVKRGLVPAVVGTYPSHDFLAANGLEMTPALFDYLRTGARDRSRIADLIPDSFVDRLAIAGTVDDCASGFQALVDAGIEHPLLAPVPVNDGGDIEIVRRFVREILPALRPPPLGVGRRRSDRPRTRTADT